LTPLLEGILARILYSSDIHRLSLTGAIATSTSNNSSLIFRLKETRQPLGTTPSQYNHLPPQISTNRQHATNPLTLNTHPPRHPPPHNPLSRSGPNNLHPRNLPSRHLRLLQRPNRPHIRRQRSLSSEFPAKLQLNRRSRLVRLPSHHISAVATFPLENPQLTPPLLQLLPPLHLLPIRRQQASRLLLRHLRSLLRLFIRRRRLPSNLAIRRAGADNSLPAAIHFREQRRSRRSGDRREQ
jgi:hypothetical protein